MTIRRRIKHLRIARKVYRDAVRGKTAYLFKANDENDMNVLIWQSDGYVFQISSLLDPEEMVKIGESVK